MNAVWAWMYWLGGLGLYGVGLLPILQGPRA